MSTRIEAKAAADTRRRVADTQSKIALGEAETKQTLAKRQGELALDQQRREARRADQRARREDRQERAEVSRKERKARAAEKREKRAERLARARERAERLAENGADTASNIVYGVALAAAMGGQISTVTAELAPMWMGWSVSIGVVLAVFVEGAAVAAALTSHRIREKGGRPFLSAILTWVFAGGAATIQWYGHHDESEILAAALVMATLIAVTVHEMRGRARATEAAIGKGRLPIRWGWRRWLVAPLETWRAWRVDVLTRSSAEARTALAMVRQMRLVVRARKLKVKAIKRGDQMTLVTIVVATDTDPGCDHPACLADTRGTGLVCTGHGADRFNLADAIAPDTVDPDAPDTGPDALVVPSDWLSETPPVNVDALLSALMEPALVPDTTGADTNLPEDDEAEDTELSEVDADTPPDTTDGDADADTELVADGGQVENADTEKASAPTRTRRRTRGQRTTARTVDHDRMVSARTRLLADGRRVSARAMAAETGYGHTACGKWLKDHPEDKS